MTQFVPGWTGGVVWVKNFEKLRARCVFFWCRRIKTAVLLTLRLAYVTLYFVFGTCFQVCTELTPVTVLYWPWSDAAPLTGQSVPGVGAVVRREEPLLWPLSSDPLPLLCHCPPRPLRFWQVILMSMQVIVGVVVVGPLCNLRRLPRKYPGKNRMTRNETESSQTKKWSSTFPLHILHHLSP